MENYIVSARKYRPTTFLSVVGQRSLTQTLKNAIQSNKLAHAYLFCGPRGVGKTTCARIFAKSINCSNPTPDGEACNCCESCMSFNEGRSYNIHELDAASNNSVEDIRQLIDQVRIPPQLGKYKVFIIDEVHMLSPAAFNAFLKTLEEPPQHALFILATTEKHKILPTILSRCQIYDFQRISISDTVEHLKYVAQSEGIAFEEEALSVIAQKSDGGMRDALSVFDQMSAYSGGNITYKSVVANLNLLDYDYYFRLTDAFIEGNVPEALLIFDEILKNGFEAQYFVSGLSNHLRDLLVCKDPVTIPLLEVGESVARKYSEQASKCTNEFLYRAIDISNTCDFNYKVSSNKRLLVELSLIKISQLNQKKKSDQVEDLYWWEEYALESISSATPPMAEQKTEAQPTTTSLLPNKSTQIKINKEDGVKIRSLANSVKPSLRQVGTISILQSQKPQTQVAESVSVMQEVSSTQFTVEQLQKVWLEYTTTIPTETILVSTMKNCSIELKENYMIKVVVTNADQQQRLNDRRDSLLPYLRSALKNTYINMEVSVSAPSMRKTIFSPLDKLNYMVSKNPNIVTLYKEFDLEIM
ncbi:MAG: DNA polymerase III subunit gamma/tau [Muribaculaceae bacterium]|nr:DNA polymerase III subunit gamma/tau [Muribaculaceae bacterium]